MSQRMWQLRPQSRASASEPSQLIQLTKSQALQKNYTESLRSTACQIMTSEEGQKSKIRTSSTKQVAGMFRRATEAKANCSLSRLLINKFLTQNSKEAAICGSKCQRHNKTSHHTSTTKARNIIKGRTRTKTKNQDSGGSIVSFIGKQRAHHQRLPRHERNSREDKKQTKHLASVTTTRQGS